MLAKPSKKLDYYFDFLSPYSYLSWTWLRDEIEMFKGVGVKLKFVPVILSQVIGMHETKGPAEIESKRNFLFKDCLRKSHKRGVPFRLPNSLPFNSLYVLRMCLAVEESQKAEFVDTIFRAGWEKGLEIGEEESLKKILLEAGFNAEELLDKVGDREIRKALKTNVKEAHSKGVFGVPSFIINNELFWGDDCREQLFDFIKGEDNYNRELYNYFENNYPHINQ